MQAIATRFIPFDSADFAPDDKATLMGYMNEEQPDELMNFAIALLALQKQDLLKVTVTDIGKTGLLLNVVQPQTTATYFLPFAQALAKWDDFQAQYILLLQISAKILGYTSIQLKKRQFSLVEKYAVTTNIVRLVLKSDQDLSHLPAGYAFLLNLAMSTQKNQRAVRYYTLRKAWHTMSEHGEPQNLAWIDVYCHGEKNGEISLGENWINSLKAGDRMTSEREFPEKIEHLVIATPQGHSLLIADETSLPTVARLLEQWQNPQPPIVMAFMQNLRDLAYLEDVLKQHPATLLLVIADIKKTSQEQIFTTLSDFLKSNPLQIDSVWGGLEATTTKKLRPLLCDLLNLTREKMVLKVYWRKNI